MKGRELQAAMCGPRCGHLYISPYFTGTGGQNGLLIAVFQSGRTFYQWNPNHRPTLHDLICRLDGGMHEVSHTFWTYENTRTMRPSRKCAGVRQPHTNLFIRNIHRRIGITRPVQAKPVPVAAGNAPGHGGHRNRLALALSRQRTKTHSWKNKQSPIIQNPAKIKWKQRYQPISSCRYWQSPPRHWR